MSIGPASSASVSRSPPPDTSPEAWRPPSSRLRLIRPYNPKNPTSKQSYFLLLNDEEAGYGGAAGGGRSEAGCGSRDCAPGLGGCQRGCSGSSVRPTLKRVRRTRLEDADRVAQIPTPPCSLQHSALAAGHGQRPVTPQADGQETSRRQEPALCVSPLREVRANLGAGVRAQKKHGATTESLDQIGHNAASRSDTKGC